MDPQARTAFLVIVALVFVVTYADSLLKRRAKRLQWEREVAEAERARYLEHIARLERMLLARDATDAATAERIMAAARATGASDLTAGVPPPGDERGPDQLDEMWADVPRGPRKDKE